MSFPEPAKNCLEIAADHSYCIAKDELKGMLQLSLSDLPMGVTIIVMIIGLLLKT